MADDEDFRLWLGRASSDRPFLHHMLAATRRAGGTHRAKSGPARRFTGARIGRGAGVGRLLSAAGRPTGPYARRVIVKARIVRLGAKGLSAATAHLRYLQRDGTTREGERGTLYGAEEDRLDGKAFLERGVGDRHQFRFIVAPEDGAEYDDLKPLVRRLMQQAEQDLGTRLDWVAVDHFNTGHPHSHIILRGKDDRKKDLIIAREYMTQGFRARASALVDLDLGSRSLEEIRRAAAREIDQRRFTGIDRRLLGAMDEERIVRAVHRNSVEQSLRAGRLQTLARMGLAKEVVKGRWRLDPELEPILKRMGERGDIIRTMQRALKSALPERSPADYAIYAPPSGAAAPLIGRVVARGLSDEHAGRHYLIVDGVDGLSHYVDIGEGAEPVAEQNLVAVAPARIRLCGVDRTIAAVAAENGGVYTIDAHLRHDPSATEAFARTHVRRLEAIRRTTGGVERAADGRWIIARDHLARVEAYERAKVARNPVAIELLSSRPLAEMARHDGPTWLDRELVAQAPAKLGRGFGAEVSEALNRREQWLVDQTLAEIDGDTILYRGDMLAALQQRELKRVAGRLSREFGRPVAEPTNGDAIEGIVRRTVTIGDAKFALIERSHDFTLVPWRPVLERALGREVAGIVRESGISWTLGRSRHRGLDIGW